MGQLGTQAALTATAHKLARIVYWAMCSMTSVVNPQQHELLALTLSQK